MTEEIIEDDDGKWYLYESIVQAIMNENTTKAGSEYMIELGVQEGYIYQKEHNGEKYIQPDESFGDEGPFATF